MIKVNELQRSTSLPTAAERRERDVACEGATGFKMSPSKPTSREKPQQPTLDLRDSGDATNNIQKASERHSNALGSHKYHS